MPEVVIAEVADDALPTIAVRYGLLRRVVGRSARHGGFVFVPVWFSFGAEPCPPPRRRGASGRTCPLSAFVGDPAPTTLSCCQDEYGEPADAAWVRARIPAVFRFGLASLVRPECKYALVDHAFVACRPTDSTGGWEAVPFVCVSDDLQATLAFSPDGPEEETRRRIAGAFWGLLLREPDELSTFRDGYMSGGYDDGWVDVEYRGGRFAVDYQTDEDAYDEEAG